MLEELESLRPHQTHYLDPGILVDLDTAGRVVGIEVLQPRWEWPWQDEGSGSLPTGGGEEL